MTSSNGNNSDRLNRIENILDRLAIGLEETKAITNSNSRAIQAIMEQQATDRLKREEEKAQHEEKMTVMSDAIQRLIRVEEGLINMVANVDENQPTILKRLMAIENKVDTLIERNQ